MDFLNMLMQSLGAGAAEDDEEFDPQAPIDVMGARQGRPDSTNPIYGEAPERPVTKQRYVLNDDRMAPTKEELKELIPRSQGYFGSKGTLRDILGGLSDAFLVQGGADSRYDKLRDRERQGDAMFGFTENPQQAVERMAAAGYGKEAADLQDNFATQQYNQKNLASQNAGRESLANDRQFDNKDKGYNRVARWTAAGVPYSQLVTAAKQYGIEEEELNALGVTPDMTEEQRKQIGALDMSVNQQQQIPFTERKVRAQEMNAASTRINATRPRAGPAPRQPRAQTDEERLERAYNTPANQRTEYQESLIRRKENTKGSGRSSTRRQVNPPARAGWGVKPIN